MKNFMVFVVLFVSVSCASPGHRVANHPFPPVYREPTSSLSKTPFSASLFKTSKHQISPTLALPQFKRAPAKYFIPESYDPQKKMPMVLMIHGFTGSADGQDFYFGMTLEAMIRGFILLKPDGTVMPKGTKGEDGKDIGGNQFWNATDACCDFAKTGVDDAGYILALVDKMKKLYSIDPARVYVVGHSNGGFLANRLACEDGKQFAGVAVLGGGTYKKESDCRDRTPLKYIQIHAVNDGTILYESDPRYAGGRETVDYWLRRNGCSSKVSATERREFLRLVRGPNTELGRFSECSSKKDVEFWVIDPVKAEGHNPHVPFFHTTFMEAVLDRLMN